ncbi:hypothetical protein HaLaN_19444, partial [Haematococcus lacustris]
MEGIKAFGFDMDCEQTCINIDQESTLTSSS